MGFLLKNAALFFLFSLIYSCSLDTSSMAVLSAEAVGNWVNFDGSPLAASEGLFKNPGNSRDIRLSPCEFYIDIRTIKLKNDSGAWITLLDRGLSENSEIIGTGAAASRSLVKPGDYTALFVCLGENWYLKGSYTNSKGTVTNIVMTNTGSYETNCFLFKMAQTINSNAAGSAVTNKGYLLKSGDYKQVYLFFDTLGIIHLLTNSQGNVSNISLGRPTLEIYVN